MTNYLNLIRNKYLNLKFLYLSDSYRTQIKKCQLFTAEDGTA
ncbi:Uncharacterized protein dnm_050300 [Desulfonema magnum]|uniref:Uncharacterized protein n=1 Tax=Desulfonema magnum TaxID=45655 RepID=A0A975BP16_9BACT|nr:Uncharacterized protein dnm_050300 [Desulfonema magnum]